MSEFFQLLGENLLEVVFIVFSRFSSVASGCRSLSAIVLFIRVELRCQLINNDHTGKSNFGSNKFVEVIEIPEGNIDTPIRRDRIALRPFVSLCPFASDNERWTERQADSLQSAHFDTRRPYTWPFHFILAATGFGRRVLHYDAP